MTFKHPKNELPEKGRPVFLKFEPILYEAGYVFDGEHFRRRNLPSDNNPYGEPVTRPVLGWAYEDEFKR